MERPDAYWRARLTTHTEDSYAGIPMQKFPEDLRVYEHLMWEARSNVIIELGSNLGGSTLWFRDRLLSYRRYGRIGRPHVIAVDVNAEVTAKSVHLVDPDARHITFITGDVLDPALPDQVGAHLRPGDRALVIEDTAHEYDTTLAALKGFARFVATDSFLVVEDGVVDEDDLRITPKWPRGVLPALHEWLETPEGKRFAIDRDLELYGLTCHPYGFLRRTS